MGAAMTQYRSGLEAGGVPILAAGLVLLAVAVPAAPAWRWGKRRRNGPTVLDVLGGRLDRRCAGGTGWLIGMGAK